MMSDAEAMLAALHATGHEPFAYSGRVMYGDRCVAVRLDGPAELFRLGVDLASTPEATEASRVPTPSVDTLGLGIVAYWSDLRWPA